MARSLECRYCGAFNKAGTPCRCNPVEFIRIDFEKWYSDSFGAPLSVLRNLRDFNRYKETEGDRLNTAYSAWMCAYHKYWKP